MTLKFLVAVWAMLAVIAALTGPARADVRIPNIYSDHMVLQRDVAVPLHGTASPNSTVTVTVEKTGGKSALRQTATSGADGAWTVNLPPTKAGGPYSITFDQRNAIVLNDVVFGEVWLCSGQSNMAFTLSSAKNAEAEIAAANHPEVRFFSAPTASRMRPQSELVVGSWKLCTPDTAPGMSAVAYFFARDLAAQLKVPVGVVISAVGATAIESWENRAGLASSPDLSSLAVAEAKGEADYPPAVDVSGWQTPDFDDSSWKTMSQPTGWEKGGLGADAFLGAVWFRREVTIPDSWTGKPLTLNFGPIDDGDTTYFNGVKVGGLNLDTPMVWTLPRKYTAPASLATSGRAVIAVRVTNQVGDGGLLGTPDQMSLAPADGTGVAIPLAGDWRYAVEEHDPPLSIPTTLYDSLIAPWTGYPVAGVVWYQGESNAGDGDRYRVLLNALFSGWRSAWGQNNLRFLVVQLPNFKAQSLDPTESSWAELRDAQARAVAQTPDTAMVVTIDLGEADNIHPKNKQDVGARLALAALATAYGKHVLSSGPICTAATVDGANVRLQFRIHGKSLIATGGVLKGFAIAGKDRHFAWADATIQGDTIALHGASVTTPVYVRYAWADNPVANLTDDSGLPAAPFETDGDTVIP